MATRAPSFPFYPRDFVFDTQSWTAEEVGAYMLILCEAWYSERPGHVPNDPRKLARMGRLNARQWARCSDTILGALKVSSDGSWLYSRRMVSVFEEKIAFMANSSEAGKRSAEVRAQKKRDLMPTNVGPVVEPNLNQGPTTVSTEAQRNGNSAVCSLLSASASADPDQNNAASPTAPLSLEPVAPRAEKAKPKARHRRETSGCVYDIDAIYDAYPRKDGKEGGFASFSRQIKTQADFEQLQLAVKNFAAKMAQEGREARHVPYFSTWANSQWRDYVSSSHVAAGRTRAPAETLYREWSGPVEELESLDPLEVTNVRR